MGESVRTPSGGRHRSNRTKYGERHAYASDDAYAGTDEVVDDEGVLQVRESIRFSPRIRSVLLVIWLAADRDESGSLNRAEYLKLNHKLQIAMLGKVADGGTEETVERDWAAHGGKDLDFSGFASSWFHLADHWANRIDERDFHGFLLGLAERMVEAVDGDKLVFRDDDAIITHGGRTPLYVPDEPQAVWNRYQRKPRPPSSAEISHRRLEERRRESERKERHQSITRQLRAEVRSYMSQRERCDSGSSNAGKSPAIGWRTHPAISASHNGLGEDAAAEQTPQRSHRVSGTDEGAIASESATASRAPPSVASSGITRSELRPVDHEPATLGRPWQRAGGYASVAQLSGARDRSRPSPRDFSARYTNTERATRSLPFPAGPPNTADRCRLPLPPLYAGRYDEAERVEY